MTPNNCILWLFHRTFLERKCVIAKKFFALRKSSTVKERFQINLFQILFQWVFRMFFARKRRMRQNRRILTPERCRTHSWLEAVAALLICRWWLRRIRAGQPVFKNLMLFTAARKMKNILIFIEACNFITSFMFDINRGQIKLIYKWRAATSAPLFFHWAPSTASTPEELWIYCN